MTVRLFPRPGYGHRWGFIPLTPIYLSFKGNRVTRRFHWLSVSLPLYHKVKININMLPVSCLSILNQLERSAWNFKHSIYFFASRAELSAWTGAQSSHSTMSLSEWNLPSWARSCNWGYAQATGPRRRVCALGEQPCADLQHTHSTNRRTSWGNKEDKQERAQKRSPNVTIPRECRG